MNIRQEDIAFGKSSFSARFFSVDYDAVVSLRWEYTITKFYPQMTVQHWPNLRIYLRNNPVPIHVRQGPIARFLGYDTTKRRAEQMISIYEELSRHTFANRLARYTDQILTSNWFVYDSKRFMVNGDVFSGNGKLIMNVRERVLLRHPFFVQCSKRSDATTTTTTMIARLTAPSIKTYYDRDVFFALLDQLYGIRW
jgi:hypothetical protein